MLIQTKTDFIAAGTAVRNAEVKTTKTGKRVVVVSVNCGKANGESRYVNAACWEACGDYAEGVSMGDMVTVSGRWSAYIGDDGKERKTYTADTIVYVPGGNAAAKAPNEFTEVQDDELPF